MIIPSAFQKVMDKRLLKNENELGEAYVWAKLELNKSGNTEIPQILKNLNVFTRSYDEIKLLVWSIPSFESRRQEAKATLVRTWANERRKRVEAGQRLELWEFSLMVTIAEIFVDSCIREWVRRCQ